MKILVFGGGGQLGQDLRARAQDLQFDVAAPVAKEVDIRDRDQVAFLVHSLRPDVVVNCAAYTAVDKAEQEPEVAFAVNRDGARNVAVAARANNARLIHISTDYVFGGTSPGAMSEDDAPSPVNVYGRSKLAGEEAIHEVLGGDELIVRTQALFGLRGNNFIHTLLSLCTQRDVLRIVDDQIVSPTYAGWLAEVLIDLVRLPVRGIVHASSRGGVSWYQVAEEVLRRYTGGLSGAKVARLEPISASSLGRPAERPRFLTLNTGKLESLLGRPVPDWKEGVYEYLRLRKTGT